MNGTDAFLHPLERVKMMVAMMEGEEEEKDEDEGEEEEEVDEEKHQYNSLAE